MLECSDGKANDKGKKGNLSIGMCLSMVGLEMLSLTTGRAATSIGTTKWTTRLSRKQINEKSLIGVPGKLQVRLVVSTASVR